MEAKTKMTQQEEILDHLAKHGTITRLEAACELHIFELASRIGELKKKGYNISSKRVNSTNKRGRKTHYNIYKLEA
jgi:predicted ArsR family transcriptional regulator